MIPSRQDIVDRLRWELQLSFEDVSDDELWEKTKGSFMASRIALGISIESFKKELKKSLMEDIKRIKAFLLKRRNL